MNEDLKFDDLKVGQQVQDITTTEMCTIKDLTTNSVLVHVKANKNSVKKSSKKKDDDQVEVGKLKGVDSYQWYAWDGFDGFQKNFIVL